MVKPVDSTSPQYQTFKTQLAELHKLMLIAKDATDVSALTPYFQADALQEKNDFKFSLNNNIASNDPRLFLIGVTRGHTVAPQNYLNEAETKTKNCDTKIKFQSLPFAELSPLQIALATLSIPNSLNSVRFTHLDSVIKATQLMYFKSSKQQNLAVDKNDLFQIDFLLYAAEETLKAELKNRNADGRRAYQINEVLKSLEELKAMVLSPGYSYFSPSFSDKYYTEVFEPVGWHWHTPSDMDDIPYDFQKTKNSAEPSSETQTQETSENQQPLVQSNTEAPQQNSDTSQQADTQGKNAPEQKPATPQKPENFYHNPSKRTKVLQKIAAALVAFFSVALYPLYVWFKTREKTKAFNAFSNTKDAKVMCDRNLNIAASAQGQDVFELEAKKPQTLKFRTIAATVKKFSDGAQQTTVDSDKTEERALPVEQFAQMKSLCLAYPFEYERRLFGKNTDKALFDNARTAYASRMTLKAK